MYSTERMWAVLLVCSATSLCFPAQMAAMLVVFVLQFFNTFMLCSFFVTQSLGEFFVGPASKVNLYPLLTTGQPFFCC